jgi:hypothetical protein
MEKAEELSAHAQARRTSFLQFAFRRGASLLAAVSRVFSGSFTTTKATAPPCGGDAHSITTGLRRTHDARTAEVKQAGRRAAGAQ